MRSAAARSSLLTGISLVAASACSGSDGSSRGHEAGVRLLDAASPFDAGRPRSDASSPYAPLDGSEDAGDQPCAGEVERIALRLPSTWDVTSDGFFLAGEGDQVAALRLGATGMDLAVFDARSGEPIRVTSIAERPPESMSVERFGRIRGGWRAVFDPGHFHTFGPAAWTLTVSDAGSSTTVTTMSPLAEDVVVLAIAPTDRGHLLLGVAGFDLVALAVGESVTTAARATDLPFVTSVYGEQVDLDCAAARCIAAFIPGDLHTIDIDASGATPTFSPPRFVARLDGRSISPTVRIQADSIGGPTIGVSLRPAATSGGLFYWASEDPAALWRPPVRSLVALHPLASLGSPPDQALLAVSSGELAAGASLLFGIARGPGDVAGGARLLADRVDVDWVGRGGGFALWSPSPGVFAIGVVRGGIEVIRLCDAG